MYMEEHKMNQQQKKETKKLPSFYIALCCCVLAIGIAGYYRKTQFRLIEYAKQ